MPVRSHGYLSNWVGNELMGLSGSAYPTFFQKPVKIDADEIMIINMGSTPMSAPVDFRLYSVLVQRELVRRLVQNPRKLFAEIGLEYPTDETILKASIATVVRKLFP